MRLNLSSQIVLNKVPEAFYRPLTAVDRSEITRLEKLPTEIYPKMEEAAEAVAYDIIDEIKQKQREGKYCVLGLGTGTSLTPVYDELIRRHKKEGVSFQNVIVFISIFVVNVFVYINAMKREILHRRALNVLNLTLLLRTVPVKVTDNCPLSTRELCFKD